ncbi:hypothetical protein GCK72_006316 [Caenorhabditis remanei]|uniref:SEC7 domain-containing protein n=1 Tax=Caenorhabditis remanei TaxID=31234 RepID=A0A6A5HGD8_CAERE|nr:hypothetical protein GCK72_006316 [Caenorhabditis remanei]KAF1766359.1 hypothetical protein GCK72_006316 [Caenorhabditis remanei]
MWFICVYSTSKINIMFTENAHECPRMNPTVQMKSMGAIFLAGGIKKILDDRDIKRKENLQLKKACECVLEDLKAEEEHKTEASSSFEADHYFLSLELACNSKSPEIVVSSLACIQKLIAYGYLTGNGVDTSNPGKKLIDRIVTAICAPIVAHGANETVLLNSNKAILEVVLSSHCEVHGESLIHAVRTCFNMYLTSKNKMNQATSEVTMKRVINTVIEKLKQFGDVKDDETIVREVVEMLVISTDEMELQPDGRAGIHKGNRTKNNEKEDPLSFQNVYQEDVFLVFQELCILSQIEENETTNEMSLRFKLLIMEILLGVLQTHSVVLQSSQPCITVMKRVLCIALTQNATLNPNIQVFERSCDVFVVLLDKFKAHLKASIEVFFKDIILPILVLDAYSFEQKMIVMKTIEKILTNPQSVVDMYVNYDLGLTSGNLFKLIVEEISKTTVLTANDYTPYAQKVKEREMRLLGLSCLSNILQCLADWWQVCEVQQITDDLDEATNQNKIEKTTVQTFEALKQQKNLLEQGIQIFAEKPKKGLKFLQDNGFVGESAIDVADFMMKEERLDKTQVGDYLGDIDDFNISVMNAYIDILDFSSIDILAALRLFLEKFRLPGEAQKIDRLMMKFASRYIDCNPNQEIFASASAAYVLAYSIILLTTDLHNKTIKNKITKEGYFSMNRGVNDGANFPEELLVSIFNDISKNEIKMKAGATALLRSRVTPGQGALATYEERKKMAALEMEAMSQTARALMESASDTHSHFTPAQHQHHVNPMFEMCWAPCLVAFSMGVQLSDDEEEWSLCLKGLRVGTRAACVLQERNGTEEKEQKERNKRKEAFIKALVGFTLLAAPGAKQAPLLKKNTDVIHTLLLIGKEDGEYLDDSWIDVMRCMSSLDFMQLIGGKLPDIPMNEATIQSFQEAFSYTFSQSVVVPIDRIFTGSSRLSSEAIIHFVHALCEVSREELAYPEAPRMFLLGKVVEVAFYNMNRIRFEWGRIWNVIGEHFNAAGCSSDESVACYSIDALRQLSIKFLEKGELPNFRFQKEFLRPFEVMMRNNQNAEVRNLVVQCCTYLVKAHSSCLRSGWQNIFSVMTISSGDESMEVVKSAFQTTSYIVEHRFKHDFLWILESFQDVLKCLEEFACNPNLPGKNTEAIRLIGLCAASVSENSHKMNEESHSDSQLYKGLTADQHIWLRGWLPIFLKLSSILNESKSDVRKQSLNVLFEIMEKYGSEFKDEWWKDLFDIIFRIFDPSKIENHNSDKQEWISTTCNHAMPKVVNVFTKFFTQLSTELLPIIYKQFSVFIQQQNEQIALCTISCFETLISKNGEKFTESMWDQTIELIRDLCSTPTTDSPLPLEFYVTRYELVDSISRIVLGDTRESLQHQKSEELFLHISPQSLLRICDVLAESYRMAKLENPNKPNLIKLETRSLSTMLSITVRLLYDLRAKEISEEVFKRVLEVVSLSFEGYGSAKLDETRGAYGDVVCELLSECNSLPNEMISLLGSEFPSKLCDLVKTVKGRRMRDLLSDSLRKLTHTKNTN